MPARAWTDPPEVVFGSRDGEFLSIAVLQRPYADRSSVSDTTYDWDADWVRCLVEAKLRGFRASFEAYLRTNDFPPFRDALRTLWEKLQGAATFTTLEGQVALRVQGDGIGHMMVSGELEDIAGTGNRLRFALKLDQTHIASSLRQLDELIDRFPDRR